MNLDATAGNRMMWSSCNRNPPYVIFLDKEHDLLYAPDIIADHKALPFRDNTFETIFFDPPYWTQGPPWMLNKKINPGGGNAYYGKYSSKRDMFSSIDKAQREFARVGKRLCFKWGENEVSLWKILPFFRNWVVKQEMEFKSKQKRGKSKTWWVTFVRSSLSTANTKPAIK